MEDKKLIELLGLSKWFEHEKETTYPCWSSFQKDEREELIGKPIKYLNIKPEVDYYEDSIGIISAPLGMGKSYCFKKKLKGTTCVITPRKSVTKAFARDSEIDFMYYIDEEASGYGVRKTEELVEADDLAIVNLSLNRLISDKAIKGYDNLIIDEIELVLSSSVGSNSRKPQEDENALASLIQNSKRVYCLGWLIRDYTIEYLQSLKNDLKLDFFHRDIATDIELNVYPNEEQFFSNLNEVAKSQRVLLFTDRAKGCEQIAERIDADTDYFYSEKRPTAEQEKAYADLETKGMENQVEIFSPIVSHGYNFRNETDRTAILLLNNREGSRMSMTDLVQFMFRNRDQKVIDLYMWTPTETKSEKELEQIATTPAQFTTDKIRLFGKYDKTLHKKVIDEDLEIVKRKKAYENIALIEKSASLRTLTLMLSWLGLTKINMIPEEEDCGKKFGTQKRLTADDILNDGHYLEPAWYSEGTKAQKKYTDIANELGLRELTKKDIARWDNGHFKENLIRNKQLHDDYYVKNARNQAQGLFQGNAKFGAYQYYLWQQMKDKQFITNIDFKYSEFWIKATKHIAKFNEVMRSEGLQELQINSDDKACPLKWLKRYLTKHNFYCEINRPSKERKSALTKKAQKSCAKEYNEWKEKQKALPQKQRYRELTNFRITHYLAWLVKEKKHKEMTEEMRALRLIYDEWNMTIENYEA